MIDSATAAITSLSTPIRWPLESRWLELLEHWTSARPMNGHREGLELVRQDLTRRLEGIGFEVHAHTRPDAQDVLVAVRPPSSGTVWVGLFGHYDVKSPGEGWTTSPIKPTRKDDRIFGRGLADNLGPLALRLLALEAAGDLPGLVWVIQGEEEIGSPWAHTLYPTLELPPVALWLEETGYFEADGTQRLLARHLTPATTALVNDLRTLAAADGRGLQTHDRYLNKAFGQDRCPCLTWLVGQTPYLAIGPNDTRSRIHAANESLPLATLDLSARQFLEVLRKAAAWH